MIVQDPTPSISSLLPSPFLTCYASLRTSFGGMGLNLRRWMVAQPLHQTVSKLGFSSAVRQMREDLCTAPRIISLSSLSLATDVTDATLGASGLWLWTRRGAGGTAILVWNIFGRSPQGSMDNRDSTPRPSSSSENHTEPSNRPDATQYI